MVGSILHVGKIFRFTFKFIYLYNSCTHSTTIIKFLKIPKLTERPVPVITIVSESLFKVFIIGKTERNMVFGILNVFFIVEIFTQFDHCHIQHAIRIMPLGKRTFKFNILSLRDFSSAVINNTVANTYKLCHRLF